MRFQAELLGSDDQAIVVVDADGLVLSWNKVAERTYGWSTAEATGRRVRDLIDTDETVAGAEAILESLRRGQSWSGDYWAKRRDGTRVAVYVTNTPVFAQDGRLIAVIGVSVDFTEHKADVARRQAAADCGHAIFGLAFDGTVTSWDTAAEELFGYTASEIVGQSILLLTPATWDPKQAQLRARLGAGGPADHFEMTRRRPDGTLVDVLLTASPMTDEAGVAVGQSIIAQDITLRRSVQRAVEASQHRVAEAHQVAHFGRFELDLVTGEMSWSDEQYRILGLDVDLEPGADPFTLEDEANAQTGHGWTRAHEPGAPFGLVYRIVRADSDERWIHARARADTELIEDGSVVKMTGTLVDDTERVEADRVRRAAESRFAIGFEQAAIGTTIADLQGFPMRVNTALCSLLGRSAELLVGRRWDEYGHPDDVPLRVAVVASLAAGHDIYEDERRYLRPDGTVVWVSSHVSLVRDSSGLPQYFFTQLQDITVRKQMEHELAHQALHDTLTGLPNRALLADRLVHGLAGARRRGSQLAVMFLDLDNFKLVNDSLGHTYGDLVLRHAAAQIAGAIRSGDTVARFGGDEFVVVCDDISALETEQIAERVLRALSEPSLIGKREMTVTASLGIAVSDGEATPESLLRDSDAAMYRAKERRGDRIEIFDEALRSKVERRLATASALQCALEREEFRVYYQPVIDLATGAMVSAEALLRWQHPERGLVGPNEFIHLAEETGLIVPIGAWVLERACRQLVQWQHAQPSMSVAVNISVRQMLAPDIAASIEDILRRTGVRPADLCLEMTESVLMDDVDYFGMTLAWLKSVGVDLAIDDFGTGYSSLSYLKRFPVDSVKVDRAFVDGLGIDPHDSALVAGIIAMADALGLAVTAEGVETQDQLASLKRLHCQRAQGFYAARPMTEAAMTRFVAESHRWHID